MAVSSGSRQGGRPTSVSGEGQMSSVVVAVRTRRATTAAMPKKKGGDRLCKG